MTVALGGRGHDRRGKADRNECSAAHHCVGFLALVFCFDAVVVVVGDGELLATVVAPGGVLGVGCSLSRSFRARRIRRAVPLSSGLLSADAPPE